LIIHVEGLYSGIEYNSEPIEVANMNNKLRLLTILITISLLAMACGLTSVPIALQAPTSVPTAIVPIQAPIQVPEALGNEEALLVQLYAQVNPSVVNIIVYTQQGQGIAPNAQGSGFVYDSQGHLVTNAHVVHGSAKTDVVFSDGTTLHADIVGEDLYADLAVLHVDSLPVGVQPLIMGDMSQVAVGQSVVAIGNPFGLGGTMTRGIVSALGRTIPALVTSFSIPEAIQTDAPINPGNSGGPLLNLQGEVIGVNAQIETGGTSSVNSGVGFAIPISIVQHVVPDLIASGKHAWTWLGVQGGSVTATQADAMKLPTNKGAYISQVIANGPSAKAGLQGSNDQVTIDGVAVEVGGDVITAIDGQPIGSFEDILVYIALNTKPGQEVTLTIIRDGKEMQVKVTLEERPTNFNQQSLP
jgi:S1-C subfamily serine protease